MLILTGDEPAITVGQAARAHAVDADPHDEIHQSHEVGLLLAVREPPDRHPVAVPLKPGEGPRDGQLVPANKDRQEPSPQYILSRVDPFKSRLE